MTNRQTNQYALMQIWYRLSSFKVTNLLYQLETKSVFTSVPPGRRYQRRARLLTVYHLYSNCRMHAFKNNFYQCIIYKYVYQSQRKLTNYGLIHLRHQHKLKPVPFKKVRNKYKYVILFIRISD